MTLPLRPLERWLLGVTLTAGIAGLVWSAVALTLVAWSL